MKKIIAVMVAISCLTAGAVAEVFLDAAFTVPINAGFLKNFDTEADMKEADISTVGVGAALGAIFIGENSRVGFGMKFGLNFPLTATLTGTTPLGEMVSKIDSKDMVMTMHGRQASPMDSFPGATYDYSSFGIDSLMGPAIRTVSTGRFLLMVTPGLALGYNKVSGTATQNGKEVFGSMYHIIHAGLGVDIAGIFNITDFLYAKAVLNGSLGYTAILQIEYQNGTEVDGNGGIYGGFGLTFRPEIGIGFRL